MLVMRCPSFGICVVVAVNFSSGAFSAFGVVQADSPCAVIFTEREVDENLSCNVSIQIKLSIIQGKDAKIQKP
jgi:hypothetical protein